MIYNCMKLQKQTVGKYKGKHKNNVYYKYSILVPKKHIDELGWKEGQKLEGTPVNNKGLFLFPA